MDDKNPKTPRVLPEPAKDVPLTPIIAADTLSRQGRGDILSDIQGSYTGTPADGKLPVQDADDL